MIVLTVVYCLTLNPYVCRSLEAVPDDGHAIATIAECLRGGAVGGMTFVLEHTEWIVKGWRCQERPNVVQSWRKARRAP